MMYKQGIIVSISIVVTVSTLPFGGVGHSGFGSYHGKYSFDAFSHRKAVLSTSSRSTIEGLNK